MSGRREEGSVAEMYWKMPPDGQNAQPYEWIFFCMAQVTGGGECQRRIGKKAVLRGKVE